MVVGVGTLVLVGALLWRQSQIRIAKEFGVVIKTLRSDPSTTLPRLMKLGERLSSRRLAALLRSTSFFEELYLCLGPLVSSEDGRVAITAFFHSVGSKLIKIDAVKTADIPVAIFHIAPDNWSNHEFGLHLLRNLPGLPTRLSELTYQLCLQLLEKNREQVACRKLALEAGRWHFGRVREDGVPTIYDEEAIQNDLLVRTT